ncbi:MAG: integration host factor subunit beta [Bacteroidaceae bacterium]|nr:integration host factor subunit beta [Bacteroidaceae bacterium]
MTKAEVVNEISLMTGVERNTTLTVIEAFMQVVKDSLIDKGENVYMRGFGSFIRKHRATKTARNISQGTTVVIGEHDIPSFKPAKEFVEAVSEKTMKK